MMAMINLDIAYSFAQANNLHKEGHVRLSKALVKFIRTTQLVINWNKMVPVEFQVKECYASKTDFYNRRQG